MSHKRPSLYSADQVKKIYASLALQFPTAGLPIENLTPPKGPHTADLYGVLMPYLTGCDDGDFTELRRRREFQSSRYLHAM